MLTNFGVPRFFRRFSFLGFKKQIWVIIFMSLSLNLTWAKELSHSIQIKGSDTMVNLAQAWAEGFMEKNTENFVAVTGGGSGTGIAALLNGTCDIAASSRPMTQQERELALQKGFTPQEYVVALDGLAVVVHPENPISQLTVNEVADIFTGKITNWKQVGGKDMPIVVLSREVNSGSHVYFKEHILRRGEAARRDEFTDAALLMPSSQAIADEIVQNPHAIGYLGIGYVTPAVKALSIAQDSSSVYVYPTVDHIVLGAYYISRPLIMYTRGKPQGLMNDFLNYILSEEGQRIVRDINFIPRPRH